MGNDVNDKLGIFICNFKYITITEYIYELVTTNNIQLLEIIIYVDHLFIIYPFGHILV